MIKRASGRSRGKKASSQPLRQATSSLRTVLLLLGITLVVYMQTFGSQFTNWDDNLNVSKNPSFNPPTVQAVMGYWRAPYLDLYIPVTYTAWGILASAAWQDAPGLHGVWLSPSWFHGANVLVHLSAVLMTFALLRRLRASLPAAFAGAMLFAIHPFQVEPVAWVTGLKDVLSGALAIAAIWQYICYADDSGAAPQRPGRWIHYGVALAAFVLALLAKPSAVVAAPIALLLDATLVRKQWRSALMSVAPMVVLALLCALLSKLVQPVVAPADGGRWMFRPLIAADALAFYLYKFVAPVHMGFQYDRAPDWVIANGWLYYTWLLPATALAAAVVLRRRAPIVGIALAIFILGLLPVLGLVPFAYQRYSTVADRYVYIAMLGPAIALALLLTRTAAAPGSGVKRGTFRIVALVLCALAVRSWDQTQVWHDDRSLYENGYTVNPRSWGSFSGMAGVLLTTPEENETPAQRRQRLEEAKKMALTATQLAPQNPEAFLTLGTAYNELGDVPEAERQFRKALAAEPNKPESLSALAGALATQGKLAEAEPLMVRAIVANPRLAQPHLNMAKLLIQQHRAEAAIPEVELAVQLDPGDSDAQTLLARFLDFQGHRAEALQHLRIALQINPQNDQARKAFTALSHSAS